LDTRTGKVYAWSKERNIWYEIRLAIPKGF
jgi:hypothetical protein